MYDELVLDEGAAADRRLSVHHFVVVIVVAITLLMTVFCGRGLVLLDHHNFTLDLDNFYLVGFLTGKKLRKLTQLVKFLILLSSMQPILSILL